jgi:Uma2 family endonuclease
MVYPARQLISFKEYLRIEEESVIKHEYLDGAVWAMSGGTYDHVAIATNIIAMLRGFLRGKGCRPYSSDMRIRVRSTGLATYPDASIVCGKIQVDPDDAKNTTAVNPRVLFEVLSPSTEKYDRGEKLEHYKKIPSLKEVAFVSTKDKVIEIWRKTGSSWKRHEYRDVALLQSVGCELPLQEVYADLDGEGV